MMVRDINQISPVDLKSELKIKAGELDLLAGGPPCQAFSLIGSRKSMDDDRGILLFKMVEFARVFRPKAVLIEQVKGLLSAKGSDGKPGSAIATLVQDLRDIGYEVNYKILRAADYGVAQLRDRVFIVGLLNGNKFVFPEATHGKNDYSSGQSEFFLPEKKPYLTLEDVIRDSVSVKVVVASND